MPPSSHISVYLISNGKYWKAKWYGRKPDSISLGPKAGLSERAARLQCRKLETDLNAERRVGGSDGWSGRATAGRSGVAGR